MRPNQKFALALAPLAVGLLVLSMTDAAENDAVFYGALIVFVLSQVAVLWFLFVRQAND